MPVIKSAKKQMRVSAKKKERNVPFKSELKSMVKKERKLIKDGKVEEAKKTMPLVVSIIDKACKKNLIHRNNAARKKSRLSLALNELVKKGEKSSEVKA
jgi:small subunit ribosomal protein S20